MLFWEQVNMFGEWYSTQFLAQLAGDIPRGPGVYAIVRVRRVHSLPVTMEMIYAGKSLDLRRRFREHVLPWRERNERLRQADTSWEFWFRKLPAADLDRVERDIIRQALPPGNVLTYGMEREQ
jgi:hypothetical protein